MESPDDIASLLASCPEAVALLGHVEQLGLPDCWVGAGFCRNPVWDVLHGRAPFATPLNDIDVLFFDPSDPSPARESALERRLTQRAPNQVWSVRNQARMHLRNGDAPYGSTAHAMMHWVEIATAIAARSVEGRIEISAPFGIVDLIAMVVRPTPHFASRMSLYRDRQRSKNWDGLWPKLRVLGMECAP